MSIYHLEIIFVKWKIQNNNSAANPYTTKHDSKSPLTLTNLKKKPIEIKGCFFLNFKSL